MNPSFIKKDIFIKDLYDYTNSAQFYVSNYNLKMDPFIIVTGATYKKYYSINIVFSFVEEIEANEEQSLKKEEKSINEILDLLNIMTKDTINFNKEYSIIYENFFIKKKMYKAIITTSIINPLHVIKITKELKTLPEKYHKKIEIVAQCAGKNGFTITDLIPKTQRLTKEERNAILNFMVDSKILKFEKQKTKTKSITKYYWINNE